MILENTGVGSDLGFKMIKTTTKIIPWLDENRDVAGYEDFKSTKLGF